MRSTAAPENRWHTLTSVDPWPSKVGSDSNERFIMSLVMIGNCCKLNNSATTGLIHLDATGPISVESVRTCFHRSIIKFSPQI